MNTQNIVLSAQEMLTVVATIIFVASTFALAVVPQVTHGQSPAICEAPGSNLLQNSSFETPEVPDNGFGWEINDDGDAGVDWSVVWNGAFVGAPNPAKLELHAGVNGWAASEGSQYAELDSDWDGPNGTTTDEEASVEISQSVSTVPGVTYTLSWDFSPRPDTDASENVLEVLIDGVATATNSGAGGGGTNWQSDSLTFTATTSNTEIAFRDAGTPNSVGTFLDNTSLTCEESIVELPRQATGTIVVAKQVTEGSDLETQFDFTSDFAGNFTLWSTESTSTVVAAGTYSVFEDVLDGWAQESAVCVYNDDPESTSTPNQIVVTEGDSVECVFTNDEIDNGGGGDRALACTLDASQNPVAEDQNFNINWTTTGANFVEITHIGSGLELDGSTTTSIDQDTTFTLTGWNQQEATTTCEVTVRIDDGGGSRSGGGEKIELTERSDGGGSDSDDTEEERPEPEVLGEQVSAVPAAAPATGAGGTQKTSPLASVVALLGMFFSFGVLRVTRNG